MHLIDLIEKELQAYRQTGRAIHLAHAARALDEARSMVGAQTAEPLQGAQHELSLAHVGTATVSVTLFRQSVTWSTH